MPVLTVADAILRGIFLILGVGIGVALLVLRQRAKDEDFEWGCLPILMMLLALTLVIGGVAGPEAARDWWN